MSLEGSARQEEEISRARRCYLTVRWGQLKVSSLPKRRRRRQSEKKK
jgi:hypothetical protein